MITALAQPKTLEKMTLSRLELQMMRAPQLPIVVTQALHLLNDADPDFDRIVRLISTDPALTARIISSANSTFMGRGVCANNPHTACISLGLNALRSVILTVGIARHLSPAGVNSSMMITELWAHSFGTAVAARCVSDLCTAQADQAYTAGLLHDIGKILLIQHARPHYDAVLTYQNEHDCFISEAIHEVLGFNHADVGVMLAKMWRLPDYLIDVIGNTHTPDKSSFPEIADAVHIGNVLARIIQLGNPGDHLVSEISPIVAQRRHLTAAILAQRFEKIETSFEEILEFMD